MFGRCSLASSSLMISLAKAPTTAVELGSNGASAGSCSFQKLDGEKKWNGPEESIAGSTVCVNTDEAEARSLPSPL